MTQEDKELLLKDLCARLPYGVEVEYNSIKCEVLSIDKYNEELTIRVCPGYSPIVKLENIKPFLFPLSSMNEEQFTELRNETELNQYPDDLELVEWENNYKTLEFYLEEVPSDVVIEVFDWLNKNHFDYRGLIPKGLAIDATDKNIY